MAHRKDKCITCGHLKKEHENYMWESISDHESRLFDSVQDMPRDARKWYRLYKFLTKKYAKIGKRECRYKWCTENGECGEPLCIEFKKDDSFEMFIKKERLKYGRKK